MKHIRSIIEFHKLLSLPEPQHPLVSVVRVENIHFSDPEIWNHFFLDFYTISLKDGVEARVKYGQQYYDYDKGVMTFTAPKQVNFLDLERTDKPYINSGSGYVLLLHPDFLHGYHLAAEMANYGFFAYATNEALHLSGREQENIIQIFKKIEQEYEYIDRHTQDIIISQIELMLSYSIRFYERQFLTRKAVNSDILTKVDQLLDRCFQDSAALKNGLPTVEFMAGELNLSTHYLSDLLRSLTGLSAQQKIHSTLIEKAKIKLSTSNLSVSEIAFSLGFEYPQSFSKLFKKKTEMSPSDFRKAFN
ncbi:helix-turn-helix transcriptional regulator [Pedobacter frigidisoli]|uniref:helix-turn-helix domain-containing protein n=1 Tax=Pedobacter frigidisoli TaxID=2530455 RepID=UPI00292F79D0|nr:helix-turn-helix transcriptional regulator [Pedobacter frigidisoli]